MVDARLIWGPKYATGGCVNRPHVSTPEHSVLNAAASSLHPCIATLSDRIPGTIIMNSTGASSSSVAIDGVGNTISRCSLEQCTTSNSNLRRCRLTNCVVLNVGNASRTRAKNSQLHNVILAERSDIKESTIQSASSVHRSDLKQSVLQEKSSLERSAITKTVVSQSQIQRSCLVDCDVAECVISRCSFTGMVLKYGIWKKGVLVGKTGDMEPIQIKQNTCSKEIVSH